MTTQDFIKLALKGNTRKDFCSSVTRLGDTVYSYGYHYPLAKIVNGKVFVNTRGYSSTTSKHIAWAMRAGRELGLDVHGVPLSNGDDLSVSGIQASALREQLRVESIMVSKKRTNTQVYRHLANQQTRLIQARLAVA